MKILVLDGGMVRKMSQLNSTSSGCSLASLPSHSTRHHFAPQHGEADNRARRSKRKATTSRPRCGGASSCTRIRGRSRPCTRDMYARARIWCRQLRESLEDGRGVGVSMRRSSNGNYDNDACRLYPQQKLTRPGTSSRFPRCRKQATAQRTERASCARPSRSPRPHPRASSSV